MKKKMGEKKMISTFFLTFTKHVLLFSKLILQNFDVQLTGSKVLMEKEVFQSVSARVSEDPNLGHFFVVIEIMI